MTEMPEDERETKDDEDVGMPGFDEGYDPPWEGE
jgi:hypothetical protein